MTVLLTVAGVLMFFGLIVIVLGMAWPTDNFVISWYGIIAGIALLGSGAVLMLVWIVLFFLGLLRR